MTFWAKNLQEKLKPKWAGLLIHCDVTILRLAAGFNKYYFQVAKRASIHQLSKNGHGFPNDFMTELKGVKLQ